MLIHLVFSCMKPCVELCLLVVISHLPNDSIPSLTKEFSFNGALGADLADIKTVRYQLVAALDSAGVHTYTDINGTGVPMWQIERIVDGSTTALSAPFVTHFNVSLQDDLGIPATTTNADQVRIQISMGMPYGEEAYLPETHWGTTVSLNN